MIPENLREEWAREVERQELLFLACNGGGWPDVLKDLEPAGRRVALRRIGFRGGGGVRHAHRSDEGGHAR